MDNPPNTPLADVIAGQNDHIVVSAVTSDGFAMGACPSTTVGPVMASDGYRVPAIGLPSKSVTECSLPLIRDADSNVTPLYG